MKHIESLAVKYRQEKVGTLSLSADGKVIVAIVVLKLCFFKRFSTTIATFWQKSHLLTL